MYSLLLLCWLEINSHKILPIMYIEKVRVGSRQVMPVTTDSWPQNFPMILHRTTHTFVTNLGMIPTNILQSFLSCWAWLSSVGSLSGLLDGFDPHLQLCFFLSELLKFSSCIYIVCWWCLLKMSQPCYRFCEKQVFFNFKVDSRLHSKVLIAFSFYMGWISFVNKWTLIIHYIYFT